MAASDGTTATAAATAEKRGNYLQTLRVRLLDDLEKTQALAEAGQAELSRVLPQAERATQETLAFAREEAQRQYRRQLVKYRLRSIIDGIFLTGIAPSVMGFVAVWVFTLLLAVGLSLAFSGMGSWFSVWGFLAIWLPLAVLAVFLAARRKARSLREAVAALGTLGLRFGCFDEHESGDPAFPYRAALGPVAGVGAGSAPWDTNNFTIDKRFGSQQGSMFLFFVEPGGRHDVRAAFRLPTGVQAQAIPFHQESWDKHGPHWVPIGVAVANHAMTHVPLFQALARAIDEHGRHLETIRSIQKRIETLAGVEKNWADVAVDMPVLDQLLKLVDLFMSGRKPSPKGVLLYGPPGTGKTLIARKLAKHADCGFKALTISDLKSEHIGGTGQLVKKIWQECRKQAPCILFIDECESAFAKRGGLNTDQFSEELVQTFLSEWDGFNESSGQVFVVAATNQRERIDNAIMSRFTTSLHIAAPDAAGRRRILGNELGKARIGLHVTEAMVQETSGMAGRELHTLVATLVAEHLGAEVSEADFLAEARKLRGKSSTNVESRLGWDDIVLPEQTRDEFQSLGKELRHAEELAAMNISVPRGILLYGPPGTGKTQLARVLAQQSGLSFLAKSSSELKAGWIGQSAAKVSELFEQARGMAPCLVFLDEIDAISPQRGSSDSFSDDIVAQLLQELDGVKSSSAGKVFLLAATNHPEKIDAAVLSRLDRKIELGLPGQAAREAILHLQLAGKPLAFEANQVVPALAARTEGLSGRDLASLVTAAARKAVQRALKETGDPTRLSLRVEDFDG